MPFITEEIYSILFKKFKDLKSIHLENWPTSYENISQELAKRGKLGIDIIKFLRMNKSKLQIPLNQEIKKVFILTEENHMKDFKNLKQDIKNTIRIGELKIIDKLLENSIKEKPDQKQEVKELNISIYIFK